jgi:hypothetical protein
MTQTSASDPPQRYFIVAAPPSLHKSYGALQIEARQPMHVQKISARSGVAN